MHQSVSPHLIVQPLLTVPAGGAKTCLTAAVRMHGRTCSHRGLPSSGRCPLGCHGRGAAPSDLPEPSHRIELGVALEHHAARMQTRGYGRGLLPRQPPQQMTAACQPQLHHHQQARPVSHVAWLGKAFAPDSCWQWSSATPVRVAVHVHAPEDSCVAWHVRERGQSCSRCAPTPHPPSPPASLRPCT